MIVVKSKTFNNEFFLVKMREEFYPNINETLSMKSYFYNLVHHFLFWTLLLITISFLCANFLFSSIENYKINLASELSEMIDTPVTIGKLHAKFRGIQPELQLSQLNIANEKIKLKEIRLSINVWQFISTQNFLTSVSVTLVGAQITLIRHVDDSITLEGLKAGDGQPLWLLQGKYLLLQSSITWRDEKLNTPPRKISPVNLAIMNNGEQHRVNLLAKLSQQSEPLRVSGDFSGNPFEPKTLNGKIFLEDKNLKLDELESFGLPLSFKIIDGFANLKMWGLWQNGQLRLLNQTLINS